MTTQKQMTEKELDQVNGGVVLLVCLAALKPSTTRKGNSTRFVTYTERGSPFKVEIHQPVFRNDPIGVPSCPE
jgi:bacteriocin-like protein